MPFSAGNLNPEAAVFDLDGTLIDSIDVYVKILNTAFRRIGVPEAPRDQVLAAIREGGFDWNLVLTEARNRQREEIIQKTRAMVGDLYEEIFRRDVTLISGVDLLLKNLSARGTRLGIVTSTQKMFIEYKLYPLQNAGIDTLIEAVITTDDVQQKKPAADPLIECGKRLSVDPKKMVYVGDTAVDIRAGKAAGTMTVGVLSGVDDYETLKAEDPDAILESIAGLEALF
ncbi:HAD family hydrolase [Thermodesulfobacteriota bacterium]